MKETLNKPQTQPCTIHNGNRCALGIVMWLYEEYGIWISVSHKRHSEKKHFSYNIKQPNGIETYSWGFYTPHEAYEEAIQWTLHNLMRLTP